MSEIPALIVDASSSNNVSPTLNSEKDSPSLISSKLSIFILDAALFSSSITFTFHMSQYTLPILFFVFTTLRLAGYFIDLTLLRNKVLSSANISSFTSPISFIYFGLMLLKATYSTDASTAFPLVCNSYGFIFSLLNAAVIHQLPTIHKSNLVLPMNNTNYVEEQSHHSVKLIKKSLEGLEGLRFLASMHIVIFHFYRSQGIGPWNIFSSWGASQLTFFFILSGFLLAFQHSNSITNVNLNKFWLKRFCRLYPSFLLSIIIMCSIIPRNSINASTFTAVILCIQTWVPSAFENNINTPGWTVGAFFLLYLIFPTTCQMIATAPDSASLRLTALWFLALCALGAAFQSGMVFGAPFGHLLQFAFKAHFSEFCFGICCGCLFARSPPGAGWINLLIRKCGGSVALIVLIIVYLTVPIATNSYLFVYSSNGLLAPLLAALVWCIARAEDIILSPMLDTPVFKYLGTISYQIYILQAVVYEICSALSITDDYLYVLIFASSLSYHLVENPCSTFLQQVIESFLSVDIHYALNSIHLPMFLKTFLYYFGMFTVIIVYCLVVIYSLEGSTIFLRINSSTTQGQILDCLKWTVIIGLPAVICTVFGQLLSNPWDRAVIPTIESMEAKFRGRLYFRIVTRGMHPNLVQANALSAIEMLDSCLSRSSYFLEIVTDNEVAAALYLRENFHPSVELPEMEFNFQEIVVPSDYKCASGAKYKARALQYAIETSTCSSEEWVVHLDEETRFDADTVRHCLHHCLLQQESLDKQEKVFGNIGQGVILYGTAKVIDNYVTTLADSIRVGDDFGKFRLQYKSHYPWIGMHGSFVVCHNLVEKEIGFDNGLLGSITEDAYFALLAWDKGVQFSWIDAYMFEQSPFTIQDFIMQRRRWFGGLWLVCKESKIKFQHRLTLLFMVSAWALSAVPVLVTASSAFVSTTSGVSFTTVLIAIMSAVTCWSYTLGFVKTFAVSDGLVRYVVLFYTQLVMQPIFSLMEIAGTIYAILNPPVNSFHIVKKEGIALASAKN